MQSVTVRKKMLARIFLAILAVLICILMVLFSYTYFATRSAILNTVSDQNSSLSAQADIFTRQFYKMVRSYGVNVFCSRAISRLRSDAQVGNADYIEGMRQMRDYASSTDYIHSIYLYNAGSDYIYCTLDADLLKGSSEAGSFFDAQAAELLREKSSTAPMFRHIDVYGENNSLISFPFYEEKGDKITSSMMINVSLDWLESFLSSILGLDNTSVFLSSGEPILESPDACEFFASDGTLLSALLSQTRDEYFIRSVGGQRYICFCAHNSQLDWHFIRIVPYKTALSSALALRRGMVILTALVTLCAVAAGYWIFGKLFRPVDRLLETMPTDTIDSSISTVGDAISRASRELKNYSALKRSEFLRKLVLIGSEGCTQQELISRNIALDINKTVSLLLLSPVGIMDALLCPMQDTPCECIDINDYSVLIAQCDRENFMETVKKASVTANFCAYHCAVSFTLIHELCAELSEIYALRLFLPKRDFYTVEVLAGRGDIQYPKRLEGRIASALNSGNIPKAAQLFEEFVCALSEAADFSTLRSHLKQLYTAVYELVDANRQEEAVREFDNAFASAASLSELKGLYMEFFMAVSRHRAIAKEREESELIARIKSCIEKNYSCPELSAAYIAKGEGLSSEYLCEIFKQHEGGALPKYITQYRLERACELLRTSSLPVSSIAQSVGYTSPQYFFTVFKSYYNVTPSKFREEV